jgi:hypothetical protein
MLKSPQAYAAEVLDTCFGDKDSALSSLYTIARNIEALPPRYLLDVAKAIETIAAADEAAINQRVADIKSGKHREGPVLLRDLLGKF